MKIKWGALVVDGRGKIGGHVASKNRGGAYLRTKVTPSNPSTLAQTLVRTIFAVISTAWSLLTSAQRASWNNAVSDFSTTDIFGDIKKPSGKNLHQKLNQNLLLVGESVLTTAPAKLSFPDTVIPTAIFDIGDETLSLDGINTAGATIAVVSSTGLLSDGTSNAKNRFRNVYHNSASALGFAGGAYSGYVAKFGAPVVGQNIQVGVQFVLASGQKSPLQILTASVVA